MIIAFIDDICPPETRAYLSDEEIRKLVAWAVSVKADPGVRSASVSDPDEDVKETEDLSDEQVYQREYYLRTWERKKKMAARRWKVDTGYRLREMARMRSRRARERSERGESKFAKLMKRHRRPEAGAWLDEAAWDLYREYRQWPKCLGKTYKPSKGRKRKGSIPGWEDYVLGLPTGLRKADMLAEFKRWKSVRARAGRNPMRAMVGGSPQWIYSSAELALSVGRQSSTVCRWLKSGTLPGCSVWVGPKEKPAAYFSQDFIDAVHRACARVYKAAGRGDLAVLGRMIREELAEAGVAVDPSDT